MILDPLEATQNFVTNLIHEKHIQSWIKLGASLFATCFISFFGTFGISLLSQQQMGIQPTVALIFSLAHASLIMSLAFLGIWLQNPATKGIAILYTGKIETERLKELTEEGTIYNPNNQKDK